MSKRTKRPADPELPSPGALRLAPGQRVVEDCVEVQRVGHESGERGEDSRKRGSALPGRQRRPLPPCDVGEWEDEEQSLGPRQCCSPRAQSREPPATTEGGERSSGEEDEHDALRIRHREDVTERKDREVDRRAPGQALAEQPALQGEEESEAEQEREVGDERSRKPPTHAASVHDPEPDRIEGKECRVALSTGQQEV